MEVDDYTGVAGIIDGKSNLDDDGDEHDENLYPNVSQDAGLWQNELNGMLNFEFTKYSGLLVQSPEDGRPIDYFQLIADEFFSLHSQRNKYNYAEEIFLSGVDEKSTITAWKPLTVPELRTFFGLLLHMGTWITNKIQDYWRTDYLFNLRCFGDNMSRDRFLIILLCLHLAKNPQSGENIEDKIYKFRPLLN
ncbi:hypothetical protein NQ314_014678 [Rhamnusium bicolor]|uniref:PiggyBac transposable element-derived protein domain-containing protein n=1 Tax=Rhamnusium bicolor TaxID=1586634 RepID=A0AAV8X1S4_9CUCU|nr:hypothetical protein NQ314_014678 [Rhamnusium bicolor]